MTDKLTQELEERDEIDDLIADWLQECDLRVGKKLLTEGDCIILHDAIFDFAEKELNKQRQNGSE